jgi:hypothetical protein
LLAAWAVLVFGDGSLHRLQKCHVTSVVGLTFSAFKTTRTCSSFGATDYLPLGRLLVILLSPFFSEVSLVGLISLKSKVDQQNKRIDNNEKQISSLISQFQVNAATNATVNNNLFLDPNGSLAQDLGLTPPASSLTLPPPGSGPIFDLQMLVDSNTSIAQTLLIKYREEIERALDMNDPKLIPRSALAGLILARASELERALNSDNGASVK